MKWLSIPFPTVGGLAALKLRQCLALDCARDQRAVLFRRERAVRGGGRKSPGPYTPRQDGFRMFLSHTHPTSTGSALFSPAPDPHASPSDWNPSLLMQKTLSGVQGVFEILTEAALSIDWPPGSNIAPKVEVGDALSSAPGFELPLKPPWPYPARGPLHLSGLEGVSELCPIQKGSAGGELCEFFSFPF